MMIIMKLALQVATVTAGCRRLRVTSSSLPKKHPRVLASSCRMRERQPGLGGGRRSRIGQTLGPLMITSCYDIY